MSQPSEDWFANFNQAENAYSTALYSGALLSSRQREAAAREFRDWIDIFKAGNASSFPVLEAELENETSRYKAAARLLIELAYPEPLLNLSNRIIETGKPHLGYHNLELLWIAVPPPLELFPKLNDRWEQLPLLRAMLRRPSALAELLLGKVLDGAKTGLKEYSMYAIEAAFSWIENDRLRRIMNQPPADSVADDYYSFLLSNDDRLEAAFYLSLRGEVDGIRFLENVADENHAVRAAYACNHLALLALPSVIRPAEKVLRSGNADAVAIALDVSSDIGLPALIPALLEVAQLKAYTQIYGPAVCDEAIRHLRQIIGAPLENLREEYVPDSFPSEYRETFREEAIQLCQKAMSNFQPIRRYHSGELVTLASLAENLLSPHSGPIHLGAYNLRAITGEDYGFDPNADLITNLPAIDAWKKRAENLEPLIPGGWAFRGVPLSDPIFDA